MSYISWYWELVYSLETGSIRITISIISPVLRHMNINNLVYAVKKWRKHSCIFIWFVLHRVLFQCLINGIACSQFWTCL